MQVEKDPITGVNTTGHEWDGCTELDTPVPKAFKVALLIAVLIAATVWVLMPAWPYKASDKWPYVTSHTKGLLGYSQRAQVANNLAALAQKQAKFDKLFTEGDLAKLAEDPKARKAYFTAAATLYRENCAMCHGRKGKGQPGFPNLVDNQWLWDGEIDGIYETIKHGINSSHDDTQGAEMPAFATDETLTPDQIKDVVEYVLSLSKQKHLPESAKRGASIFEDECSGCHSEGGVGGEGSGAPNLTDKYWIYGGGRANIQKAVSFGLKGVMPHWVTRLRDAEIRQLALYIKWIAASPLKDKVAKNE